MGNATCLSMKNKRQQAVLELIWIADCGNIRFMGK
jgi:hypothetical protein